MDKDKHVNLMNRTHYALNRAITVESDGTEGTEYHHTLALPKALQICLQFESPPSDINS